MTLQELSKYYDIQMTLEKDREALERLTKNHSRLPTTDRDAPHAGCPG